MTEESALNLPEPLENETGTPGETPAGQIPADLLTPTPEAGGQSLPPSGLENLLTAGSEEEKKTEPPTLEEVLPMPNETQPMSEPQQPGQPQEGSLVSDLMREVLFEGPIPVHDLWTEKMLDSYRPDVVESYQDVDQMLWEIEEQGSPGWWKGSLEKFQQEFEEIYNRRQAEFQKEYQENLGEFYRVGLARMQKQPELKSSKDFLNIAETGREVSRQLRVLEVLLDMKAEQQSM